MLTHWSVFFSFRFYGLLIGRSTLFMALDSGGGGGRGAGGTPFVAFMDMCRWPRYSFRPDFSFKHGTQFH